MDRRPSSGIRGPGFVWLAGGLAIGIAVAGGCIVVERAQVGPADWPWKSGGELQATSAPASAGSKDRPADGPDPPPTSGLGAGTLEEQILEDFVRRHWQ